MEKITHQPEYDALHAFDAEHGVEPFRTIAERILGKYFEVNSVTLIVDDVAGALEDAYNLGERRGPLVPK